MPAVTHNDATHPLSVVERDAIRAMADRVAEHDGTPPLSEQFRLSLESRDPDVTHLSYAAELGPVGYAQVRSGSADEPPSAEVFVDVASRRRGVGRALLAALPTDVRIWSHAQGEAGAGADAFARALGLVAVRSLHVMGRSLEQGGWPAAQVSPAHAVRHFEPGRDEDAWVATNAAAFAHHPEQGALTRTDLEQRMAQPWWDPAGLILIVDAAEPDTIVAFHWTKVDPPDGTMGEVYVVGVSPDHQGEGLGRAVTILGLDHLRDQGLRDVILYVDEDNVAAVHTYTHLGFVDREVHRQFALAPASGPA